MSRKEFNPSRPVRITAKFREAAATPDLSDAILTHVHRVASPAERRRVRQARISIGFVVISALLAIVVLQRTFPETGPGSGDPVLIAPVARAGRADLDRGSAQFTTALRSLTDRSLHLARAASVKAPEPTEVAMSKLMPAKVATRIHTDLGRAELNLTLPSCDSSRPHHHEGGLARAWGPFSHDHPRPWEFGRETRAFHTHWDAVAFGGPWIANDFAPPSLAKPHRHDR